MGCYDGHGQILYLANEKMIWDLEWLLGLLLESRIIFNRMLGPLKRRVTDEFYSTNSFSIDIVTTESVENLASSRGSICL